MTEIKKELSITFINKNLYLDLMNYDNLNNARKVIKGDNSHKCIKVGIRSISKTSISLSVSNTSNQVLWGGLLTIVLSIPFTQFTKRQKQVKNKPAERKTAVQDTLFLKINEPLDKKTSYDITLRFSQDNKSIPIVKISEVRYCFYTDCSSKKIEYRIITDYLDTHKSKDLTVNKRYYISVNSLNKLSQRIVSSKWITIPQLSFYEQYPLIDGKLKNISPNNIWDVVVVLEFTTISKQSCCKKITVQASIPPGETKSFQINSNHHFISFKLLSLCYKSIINNKCWEYSFDAKTYTAGFKFFDSRLNKFIPINDFLVLYSKLEPKLLDNDITRNQTIKSKEKEDTAQRNEKNDKRANKLDSKKNASILNDLDSSSRLTPIDEIQILDSSHNHVSLKHPVRDERVSLKIWNSNIQSVTIPYSAHYCEKCNKYFDFSESFRIQMKQSGVPIQAVTTSLVTFTGLKWHPNIEELQNEHIMHYFGYRVGITHGISDNQRHRIIRHLIEEKILTRSQIKNHLEFLIRYSGKRSNMQYAVADWENDIQYLNEH